MAKDKKTRSKRSDQNLKRRRSAADHRAAHRIHSAASAERKRAAGLLRVSVWVPCEHANTVKHVAKCLCDGQDPAHIAGALAAQGKLAGPDVVPSDRDKTRKASRPDERQLDLFGSD
jgi:hypothetical protein